MLKITQQKYHDINLCGCNEIKTQDGWDNILLSKMLQAYYGMIYCYIDDCDTPFQVSSDTYIYICEKCKKEYCEICIQNGLSCQC